MSRRLLVPVCRLITSSATLRLKMAADVNEFAVSSDEKIRASDEDVLSTSSSILMADFDHSLMSKEINCDESSYENLLLSPKLMFLDSDKELFQEEVLIDGSAWDEIEISDGLSQSNFNRNSSCEFSDVNVDGVNENESEKEILPQVEENFNSDVTLNESNDGEKLVESFSVPEKEIEIDRNIITPEEKNYHHEYFEGKFPKTPERYVKIRNYILDCWTKTKPKYLNKTSVRIGLKNCGDVNCISKIHRYLEIIGAINFGCEQVNYEQSTQMNRRRNEIKLLKKSSEVKNYSKRIRKKRLIEGDQIGGYTMQHLPNGEVVVSGQKITGLKKHRKRENPFKLITLERFTEENNSPFDVQLHLDALLIMDLHSHLSHTEVIGLVGGTFDPTRKLVHVVLAEPCLSLSTSVQCEMDPVSQTEASAYIEKMDLSVIGWYHSHPTFPPNPSITDVETQSKYQEWFGQKGSPFVAFILSPYSITSRGSQLRCMMVGEEIENEIYRKPFQLEINFDGIAFDANLCKKRMKKVIDGVEKFTSPINLLNMYIESPPITYLHKTLSSVKNYMNKVGIISSIVNEIHEYLENILIRNT